MLDPSRTGAPRLDVPAATAGMTYDRPDRNPYLLAEGALYGEVFALAIRDAGAPWPGPRTNEAFARRRAIVDGVRFLFDPDDERRYLVGRMAGMTVEAVDFIVAALRCERSRGSYNSGIRPQILALARSRADEWYPLRENPGQPRPVLQR